MLDLDEQNNNGWSFSCLSWTQQIRNGGYNLDPTAAKRRIASNDDTGHAPGTIQRTPLPV